MSRYTTAWIVWLAAFGVVELAAIIDKRPEDTLSENVWRWFAIKDPNAKFGPARRAVFLMFLAWLSAHLISGGRV